MLNYFSNVVPDVVPVPDSNNKIDLEITVEEKAAGQASVNMGYTRTYGITGGGGLALPNFLGKGQRLNFSFNVGTNYNVYGATPAKYKSASIGFTDPMVNDTKNLIGCSLYYSFRGSSSQYYSPLDFTIANEKNNMNQYMAFSYNHFGKWTLTGFYDREDVNDKVHQWPGLDFSFYLNSVNQISLFYGSQKGGLVCANGICAEQPGFEDGYKITFRSLF